jgi:hypothetical protein
LGDFGGAVKGGGGGAGLVLHELPSVLYTTTKLIEDVPLHNAWALNWDSTYCRLFIFLSLLGIQPVKRLFAMFLQIRE